MNSYYQPSGKQRIMQPFSSIKVIDLTHVIAGPFCTYQLAVMGAEVIKIELPSSPDMVRATGIQFPSGEYGLGPMFTSQNANKRAISIDLKTSQGKEILRKLIHGADILVENYRSGALANLGFDYESVKSIQQDIIYCSMTGFGQQGPLGQRTAYDNVIQAFSGLMSANGPEHSDPVKVGPPVLDYGTGIQAAYAIAAALFQRTRTGKGQYIDIAMLDAALMLMSSNVTSFHQNGKLNSRAGNMSSFNAGYGCYPTLDGLIMIGAYTGRQVCNLWTALGDPDHGEKLASLNPPEMESFIKQDTERLSKLLMAQSASYWEERLNQYKVPAARVRTLNETLAEEQLQHRTVIQNAGTKNSHSTNRIADKNRDESQFQYPTAAFKFNDNAGPKLHSAPPVFAQHTREVLSELGYNAQQIKSLEDQKVISSSESNQKQMDSETDKI